MTGAEELLTIGPGTTLRVLSHDERALEIEASYEAGGVEPPAHLHPGQDEHFELLAGEMRTRIAGREGELLAGQTLDVPAGTVHQVWNAGEERAVLHWTTTPSGRTLEWFREIDAAFAGTPREDPSTLLERFSDVFRLA
jgi:mannose-6-phosphate isomerase-like protein (cupin superfamily)